MAISIVAHERMNEADNREARAGSVADRGPATISVAAEDLAGEAQAALSVGALKPSEGDGGRRQCSTASSLARCHQRAVCESSRPKGRISRKEASQARIDRGTTGYRSAFAIEHVPDWAARRGRQCRVRRLPPPQPHRGTPTDSVFRDEAMHRDGAIVERPVEQTPCGVSGCEACGFRLAARRAHPITACSSTRNLVAAFSRRPMVAMADNSSPGRSPCVSPKGQLPTMRPITVSLRWLRPARLRYLRR